MQPFTHVLFVSALMTAGNVFANGTPECDSGFIVSTPQCELLQGAMTGDVRRVERALQRGANIDMTDAERTPLLHLLVKHPLASTLELDMLLVRKQDVVRLLIDKGVNVNALDSHKFTALHWAVRDARYNEFIDVLIDKGLDPNMAAGDLKETPLVMAIDGLNHAGLERLIRRGADVGKPIVDSIDPLMFAVLKGDVDSVALLLKHRANIDAPNSFGITPLSMAVRMSHLETIDLLVKEGASLDIELKGQLSPREVAAQSSYPETRDVFNRAVAKYRTKPPVD